MGKTPSSVNRGKIWRERCTWIPQKASARNGGAAQHQFVLLIAAGASPAKLRLVIVKEQVTRSFSFLYCQGSEGVGFEMELKHCCENQCC